jgi:hypothetical protein
MVRKKIAAIFLAMVTVVGTVFAGIALLPRPTIDKAFCGAGLVDACTPTPLPNKTSAPPIAIRTPISPTPTPQGPLLAEDFERSIIPSDWKQQSGQWTIVKDGSNNALKAIGNSVIEFGDEQWIKYKLETDIRVTNLSLTKGAWVDVHALPNLDKMIILALDFQSNYLILVSKNGIDVKELYRVTFPFQQNKWFKVRIQVWERLITVYINDDKRINYLADSIFGQGAIRFRALNNNLLFDNVLVTSLENEIK